MSAARALVVGALAALACGGAGRRQAGGGGTGGAAAGGGPDAGVDAAVAGIRTQVGPCAETTTVIPAAQTTALGFSGDDVLAATGGTHQIDLAWIPETLYAVHSRAGTRTSLALSFAAAPSEVRFIDSQGGGCPDRGYGVGEPCVSCNSRMEIDVGLALDSGDGALHEQVTVTLKTMSTRGPGFKADFDAAVVQGAYLGGVLPKAGYAVVGFHVEAGFDRAFAGSKRSVPDEWNGFVAALVVQGAKGRPIMQAHGYFPARTAGGP